MPSGISPAANQLGFFGHHQTFTWRALTQTEESDWTMVKKLAKRIGWVVYYRFGCVLLYDPNNLYTQLGRVHQARLQPDQPRDLRLGRHSEHDRVPGDRGRSEVLPQNLGKKFGFFTTDNDPQIQQQTGEFKGFPFETSFTVRDQEEAAAYITAADNDISGWRIHAVARIWGDADIYPGMCVGVMTVATEVLQATTAGGSLESVSHQADRQSYQTQLVLSRPDNWVATSATRYRPFWEEDMTSTRSRPYLQESQGKWSRHGGQHEHESISFPFRFVSGNIAATNTYDEIVRGQVIDALMTNQGERVMRPRYGCDIQAALFDPRDELVRKDAAGRSSSGWRCSPRGPRGGLSHRASRGTTRWMSSSSIELHDSVGHHPPVPISASEFTQPGLVAPEVEL